MTNLVPKKTESLILEAERSISEKNTFSYEEGKIKGDFSPEEISLATKDLFPEIWEK